MARTNIDIDDDAYRRVIDRSRWPTKQDAMSFALRSLAGEPLNLDEARALRGAGWDDDLDEMRLARI